MKEGIIFALIWIGLMIADLIIFLQDHDINSSNEDKTNKHDKEDMQ